MSDSGTPTLEASTERLLTVREVAEWLNVAEGTLRYWRHTHRGPRSLRLHGGVSYRLGDVEEWLERGAKRGAQR